MKKNVLDFIQGGIFLVLAIISIILDKNISSMVIILILSCLLGYIIIAFLKWKYSKVDTKKFQEGSSDFFKFFNDWYSKPGKLSIFCSDLDWMIKEQFDLINALCRKSNDCNIYLKKEEIDHRIKQRLESNNVHISLNHGLLTEHRFSLLETDGFDFLIISDKKSSPDKIEIKQESNSTNPYIITLVKDLLDSMNKRDVNI